MLELTGNKARAIAAAREAGLPVLKGSEPSSDVKQLRSDADAIGYPVFVKAVSGGGGRGMRRVDDPAKFEASVAEAMREADAAFGDSRVYLEQAVVNPRHIEVQILADGEGNVIHLFERDCSVQRRHQKVVELAPAPNLDPALRDEICAAAVKFARHINYKNAGTVEFLVGSDGRFTFMEMNPRIQVEHTVTEEVTDVDLVSSPHRVRRDPRRPRPARRHPCSRRGCSAGSPPRTRPTASSRHGHRPGLPLAGRRGHPPRRRHGVRRRQVGAHFDSMMVKLTCRGRDLPTAIRRAQRAWPVPHPRRNTNIGFLRGVLADADFAPAT